MKKLLIALVVVAIVVVAGVWILDHQTKADPLPPRTGLVDRGDIVEKVSANAKVVPVEVSYVSSDVPYARIAEILPGAEIGKTVKKGDQLLKLDDQIAQSKVDEAEAAVSAAEATKLQAQAKLESANAGLGQAQAKEKVALQDQKSAGGELSDIASQGAKDRAAQAVAEAREGINFAKSLIKEAESAIKTAEANIKRAEAVLRAAKENVNMLVITSPIDGTIIDKRVTSAGQVISPQTHPVLFVVVPDLNKFELEAQVGEADIARVEKGMEATFKVDAYSQDDTTFQGVVTQIAYVPTVAATRFTEGSSTGPVTYKVTLEAKPYQGKEARPLKPGLTANVDILVRRVPHALRVPNPALDYQPENLPAEDKSKIEERGTRGWRPIWTWNQGTSQLLFVQTGANDGSRTEVLKVEGGQLDAGMEVITESPPKPASGGLFNLGGPVKIM